MKVNYRLPGRITRKKGINSELGRGNKEERPAPAAKNSDHNITIEPKKGEVWCIHKRKPFVRPAASENRALIH